MTYFLLFYPIIGLIIGLITWFWNSSRHKDRIDEGGILIYLFGCIFLWPAIIFGIIINTIHYITKEYCSNEI